MKVVKCASFSKTAVNAMRKNVLFHKKCIINLCIISKYTCIRRFYEISEECTRVTLEKTCVIVLEANWRICILPVLLFQNGPNTVNVKFCTKCEITREWVTLTNCNINNLVLTFSVKLKNAIKQIVSLEIVKLLSISVITGCSPSLKTSWSYKAPDFVLLSFKTFLSRFNYLYFYINRFHFQIKLINCLCWFLILNLTLCWYRQNSAENKIQNLQQKYLVWCQIRSHYFCLNCLF